MTYLTLNAIFASCTFAITVQTPTLLPTVSHSFESSPKKPSQEQPGSRKAAPGARSSSVVGMTAKSAVPHFAMTARRRNMVPMSIGLLLRSRYLFTL